MKEDTNSSVNGKKMQDNSTQAVSVGSIVEGKVVARDRSSIFIDLGNQGTGIIYGREFYAVRDIIKNLNIGDTVFAKVVELENEEGYRELSLRDATQEISWQKLREMKEKEEIIKVKITGVNKGGLLTSVNNITAFLPVSQLSPENYPRVIDADKQKILKELQKFIGKTLEVKILDLLAEENKLILSEKAKTEQAIKKIISGYKKGDIIEGKITGIADFGVFIRFPLAVSETQPQTDANLTQTDAEKDVVANSNIQEDSIEGLIHISELDWQLVQNPAEIVKVGEIIKAQIININNNQVFLSLKSLKENPWEEVEKKYKKGDSIQGKVISFSPFGAFIEILPKIRGLCHVSEFAGQKEMEDSLKIGETYNFEILMIEPKEHRMSLKLVAKK
ncbi:MAG: RNA binding S1 domain protein [Parcubacteria group bacterium GW2011_GWA1_33_6]|uniref:30S ribosomal protein S1 n=1 Tax=Candidatus Staskawiczbacteria bacterium RIFCSPHIGHO2_02_FULL_33_16 TaxID=1802204 RepID=A0A1G2HZH6_9BACT|nr:MAG: RNA binding S1 domain protein [Parcubacteria group bacterium GW2011_GWA2_33_14]KKP55223.1 MAG: RNA binding S1 domain protein [Parcubacteria group bacterium GW2011_GWA1_33_6]OGZ67218.1 MAG: 30S ribosomal protein S1 [Candidatus Staskawiczbacteria bacterium RIFCSPHIGHO2_02_FULL_33_16]OGZ70933.1 MAG: 30S ribosomal protein S1 [Candidatus Staskawiczbacteria bacterium RIFCSPLOWO2_01_FULL_33_13]